MKKVILGVAIALAAVPAYAGTGMDQDRCAWVTNKASDNLYNFCYFVSTLSFKRWLH